MAQQPESSETSPGTSTGGATGGSPMGPPVRTMADITRLFMAGAGQPGAQRPRRIPPSPPSPPSPKPGTPAATPAPVAAALSTPVEIPMATQPVAPERPARHPVGEFYGGMPAATSPSPSTSTFTSTSTKTTVPTAMPPLRAHPAESAPAPGAPAQSAGLPALQAALAGQFGSDALTSVLEAAKLLAGQHHVAVGVIGEADGAIRVARVEGGERPVFTRTDFVNSRAPVDVQLARALYTLRDSIRHWIVVVPPGSEAARQVLAAADDWLLPTGTTNDDLIACYRSLKGVCTLSGEEKPGRKIRLLVRTGDRGEAARIHARLDRVTRGFLGQELLLVALDRPAFAIVQQVAEWPLGEQAEAAWLSVADFAVETAHPAVEEEELEPAEEDVAPAQHEFSGARAADEAAIHSVLDPEERAALHAGLGDPVEPALGTSRVPAVVQDAPVAVAERPVRRPVEAPTIPWAPPAAAAVPAATAQATPPAGWTPGLPATRPTPAAHPCLRAVEVSAAVGGGGGGITPALRWEAVRQAVADLVPGAVTLEARPPEADYALLAADAAGRLHLWTLAGPDATGWSALWQWAQAHRQLVALTRRDLAIDAAADVMVHVVLGEQERGGRGALGTGPAGVKWYRLYPVRCGEKMAAVVTPVG